MRRPDGELALTAAKQHGLLTLRQAADAGLSRWAVRRRIEQGWWVPADRGVLRVAGAPVTWESQLLACVLGAGPGALASHRSAAARWRLEGCRAGPPELVVPRNRRYRRPGVRTHESTDLGVITPVWLSGIPVTPVGRTLLDLGAVVDARRVHVALDDARRRGLTDWDALLATLVAHARRGRDGVGTLRAILDDHFGEVAVTESGFERLVASLLVSAGLPRPEPQHEVEVGGVRYRLDLAYPEPRVAIELDGRDHLRPEMFEGDRYRQNALVLSGWTVLRFTWRQYLGAPDRLVAEVRSALRGDGGLTSRVPRPDPPPGHCGSRGGMPARTAAVSESCS